jgi:hypothetical protein
VTATTTKNVVCYGRASALTDRQRRALLAALVATGNATQHDRTAQWVPEWTNEFLVENAVIALDEARSATERLGARRALGEALALIVDLHDETAECLAALLPVTPDEVLA